MEDKVSMVEEPIMEYGKLDANESYTYWDYIKWQFTDRVELIRGAIRKMNAPNTNHQRLVRNVNGAFDKFLKDRPCDWFFAPFDVRLPVPSAKKDSTVVQPDLLVVCDASKIDKMGCNGAPDLVVEILSSGNNKHEMATKYQLYEECGVKEYWIVGPDSRTILIYTLVEGKYIGLHPFAEGMQMESPLFPDLQVSVDELFYQVD